MRRPMILPYAAIAALAALSGCESTPRPADRPALITHIVLVDLKNASERADMLADADEKLATIPGVVSYAAGSHFDTGRATVLDDYDAAIVLGFDDRDALERYVDHPDHRHSSSAGPPASTPSASAMSSTRRSKPSGRGMGNGGQWAMGNGQWAMAMGNGVGGDARRDGRPMCLCGRGVIHEHGTSARHCPFPIAHCPLRPPPHSSISVSTAA